MLEPDETLERVAGAALAVAVEDGLEAVTHERVATAAGLDSRVLSDRFPERDDLIATALHRVALAQRDRADAVVRRVRAGEGAAEVNGEFLHAEIVDALAHRERAVAGFELYLAGLRRPMLTTATRGWDAAARSQIEAVTDPLTAWALHVAGVGMLLEAILADEAPSREQVVEVCRRIVGSGHGPGRGAGAG